jgi:hypothetical protein
MKMLNKNSLTILSKLQDISSSLVVSYPILGIKDIDSTIMAKIDLSRYDSEEFEEFGLLGKLSEFLSVVKLLEDPEIKQEDSKLILSDRSTQITYYTSDLDLLDKYRLNFSIFDKVDSIEPIISFTLSDEDMGKLRKASSVLKDLENITISSSDDEITISLDSETLGNTFSIKCDGESKEDVMLSLSNDNFKKIPLGTYRVSIHRNASGKVIFKFVSNTLETFEVLVAEKPKQN